MKSNPERREYWRQQVAAFESSGLTREEYCQRNGHKVHQLDYWRKRFKQSETIDQGQAGKWIPLHVTDDPTVDRSSGVCLRVGRMTIEIMAGFDREILSDVLRILDPIC